MMITYMIGECAFCARQVVLLGEDIQMPEYGERQPQVACSLCGQEQEVWFQ